MWGSLLYMYHSTALMVDWYLLPQSLHRFNTLPLFHCLQCPVPLSQLQELTGDVLPLLVGGTGSTNGTARAAAAHWPVRKGREELIPVKGPPWDLKQGGRRWWKRRRRGGGGRGGGDGERGGGRRGYVYILLYVYYDVIDHDHETCVGDEYKLCKHVRNIWCTVLWSVT